MTEFQTQVARLAKYIQNGELLAQTDPAAFVSAVVDEIERMRDRLAVKCEHPNVESCARLWQEDANQRQLASVSPALAEEFPFGCDTVEHLATALLAARERAERLQSRLYEATKAGTPYAADRDAKNELVLENQRLQAIVDRLPKTADGVPIVPDMIVWHCANEHYGPRVGELFPSRGITARMPPPYCLGEHCYSEACQGDDCSGRLLEWSDCYSTRESAEAARKERP